MYIYIYISLLSPKQSHKPVYSNLANWGPNFYDSSVVWSIDWMLVELHLVL